jgi:hypothetical protein
MLRVIFCLALKMATVLCTFCGKTFKAHGLKRHQNHCKSKPSTHPPVYKVCLINEHVFEHVLSFLGNQSLTKLQAITGDRYLKCETNLSKYCCPCENDNPAIIRGLCLSCEATQSVGYKPLVTTTEARVLYGTYDLSEVQGDKRKHYTLYARADLDKHMINTYGSRMEWLRVIAVKDARAKKRADTRLQKQSAMDAFLQTLTPGFESYAKKTNAMLNNYATLERSGARFVTLTAALKARGLKLRNDSRLCEQYIMEGGGLAEAVVDTMEEMEFLFKHTTYSRKCNTLIDAMRDNNYGEWYPRDEYREMMQDCREDAKMQLCIEYLADNKGRTLPRKWEQCRMRFENAKAAGINPSDKIRYIYENRGSLLSPSY